jgi:hypothetical protein
MTTPPPPDRSVNPDTNFNLAQAFQGVSSSIDALTQTMLQTNNAVRATLDMESRYGAANSPEVSAAYHAQGSMPQMNVNTLKALARSGAINYNNTAGMVRVSGMQALSSFAHAQSYAAQQIGQAIAGVPLYSAQNGMTTTQTQGGGGGGQGGSGGGTGGGGGGGQGGGGGGGGGGGPQQPPGPNPIPPSGTQPRSQPTPPPGGTNLQQLGARIALSGGTTSGLMHAASNLPVVGLALSGGTKAKGTYLDQREKNRVYQSTEGGTNAAGFQERMHEEAYRWTTGFGMSESAARESFQAVTALGFSGKQPDGMMQNRQAALNFNYHNYNSRGMDIGESVKILETATQNATVSFSSLSTALKDVSDTAGQAGVNAKQMRDQFNQALGAAIGQGAGAGSPVLAGALTSTKASYGRSFQNTDNTGVMSPNMQYMLGGMTGITPGQTQYLMRTQPQEYLRMASGNNMQRIKDLLSQEQIDDIKSIIESYGGSKTLDDQKATQVGNEFLNRWQTRSNIDLHVWAQVFSQLSGWQLDENTVMSWIVRQIAGDNEAAHAQAQTSATQPYKQTAKTVDIKSPASMQDATAFAKLGTAQTGDTWGVIGKMTGLHPDNNAGKVYQKQSAKTGMRDPVLEKLIQSVDDPNNIHVQVNTKTGMRVMSFADAMRNFPNELASGNATIIDGDQKGQKVADITGGIVDLNRDASSELKSDAGGKVGQSLKDWQKKHPESKSTANAPRTIIDLSPEAKKLLLLLPNNNNSAATTGTVPQNPYGTQSSRP